MTLTTEQCLAAITEHSAGFAAAARDHLSEDVEHCPGWDVADLVRHLTEVHWFWARIAEELPASPLERDDRPDPAPDDQLVDVFEAGAARLVSVLRDADQDAACWTWAPQQQNVAFITRHQVQEAAVHHFDAANAASLGWLMDPLVAADSVEEFLRYSVASIDDPGEEGVADLEGAFAVHAPDAGVSWTLSDGEADRTVQVAEGAADGVPVVTAPAKDLILWLYGRKDIDTSPVPAVLIERFRTLTFTD